MYNIIKPSDKAKQYMKNMENGFCIAYFQHEVLVGCWNHINENPRFVHDPNDSDWERLLEVHVFNKDVECRFVKVSGVYRERIADDTNINKEQYFDENMLIIGSRNPEELKEKKDFVRASESGRTIILPKLAKDKEIKIKIRNYLSFEKIYEENSHEDQKKDELPISEVMRVKDWRYVGFVDEDTVEEV